MALTLGGRGSTTDPWNPYVDSDPLYYDPNGSNRDPNYVAGPTEHDPNYVRDRTKRPGASQTDPFANLSDIDRQSLEDFFAASPEAKARMGNLTPDELQRLANQSEITNRERWTPDWEPTWKPEGQGPWDNLTADEREQLERFFAGTPEEKAAMANLTAEELRRLQNQFDKTHNDQWEPEWTPDWTPEWTPDWTPGDPTSGGGGGGPGTGGGGGTNLQLGGGGTNVAPTVDWGSIYEGLTPDKTGYESSSNKDFYQQQFQNQRFQQNLEGFGRLAAAGYESPDPEPVGNWDWANLPEVAMGAGISKTPAEYELNQEFNWEPGTTNQQILSDLRPRFNESTNAFLDKNKGYYEQGPNWVDSRQAMQDWTSGNPNVNDKGWTAAINKIGQNVWQPMGGGISGPSAPVGYALPINAAPAAGA